MVVNNIFARLLCRPESQKDGQPDAAVRLLIQLFRRILTVFQQVHTLPCLMLSYPVSWLLTFFVHTVVFLRVWPRVVRRFTEEERAAV